MNVILSDQQMRAIMYCLADWYDCNTCDTSCILIAKAQARHIFNLLNEPCTKHPDKLGMYYKHRKNCPKCMAEIEEKLAEELKKEIERG